MTRIFTALAALLALAACETAQGFGQDVETTGEAISDTAVDVEQDL